MLTIHMTTYRRYTSGLLNRAIESILSQDFSDFELIVCDDHSTDGTALYLEQVARADKRVHIVRNARNLNSVALSLGRCLQASDISRPWVSWMFDDCVLLPGALSRLVSALNSQPSALVIFGVTEVIQKDGNILRVGTAKEMEIRECINNSSVMVPNAGILVHRNVFERSGWYDSSVILRRSCDWDLFRRIIGHGTAFAAVPDVLVRELGDLQPDALRNAFTTTFELMSRFVVARDASGARLDLANVLSRPVDWIPSAAWSLEDLGLMRYMFLEYFLSIGDVNRAFRWARLLAEQLGNIHLLMRENLLRHTDQSRPVEERSLAMGAFSGIVLGAWRERMGVPQ